MSSLFGMVREYAEFRDGRIGWWSHVYLFLDAAGRKKRVNRWDHKPFPDRIDEATGKPFSVFRGRAAQCHHPDKWRGVIPYWSTEGIRAYFIVPVKDCKACEFHEPAKQGRRRYARCRWFHDRNRLDHPSDILKKSVADAQEMLRQ